MLHSSIESTTIVRVNLRDLHEHISIGVLQHNIAHHHLYLLNGLASTNAKVTNVSQKPEDEQTRM